MGSGGGIRVLIGHHISGTLNMEADWLSRPAKQENTPAPEIWLSHKVRDMTVNLQTWFLFASPASEGGGGFSAEGEHGVYDHL